MWVDEECSIHWGILSFFNNHLVDSSSSKVLPSSHENRVDTSIGKMTNLSIIESWHGHFDWCRTSFVIGCCLCWRWKRRIWTWIGARISKVSLFFIIVAFLVRWGLSLASIGILEGKVTSLSTMEANFDNLFTRCWSYIHDQYKRVMYTCDWGTHWNSDISPHNCSTSDLVGFVSHSAWLEALAHSDFWWLETCSY
jgi:hypothetical protein